MRMFAAFCNMSKAGTHFALKMMTDGMITVVKQISELLGEFSFRGNASLDVSKQSWPIDLTIKCMDTEFNSL